jgi:hypothetical protein
LFDCGLWIADLRIADCGLSIAISQACQVFAAQQVKLNLVKSE